MSVTTVDAYGAPSYGPIGRPPAGIVFHTPENADPTLASAIAVAKWQATASNTSGGSYHGILGHDSARYAHAIAGCSEAAHWTMVRSVPWDTACGGLSTTRDPAIWQPDRYPWIRQMLPAAAFSDPNRWLHQISLSGKAAWYVTNGYPPGAVAALAEWTLVLERAYAYNAVLMLHRHFQTNRTDPGPLDLPDLVLAAYELLVNPPAPPPPVDPRDAQIAELTGQIAELTGQVTALNGRISAKDRAIDAAIASLTAARKA